MKKMTKKSRSLTAIRGRRDWVPSVPQGRRPSTQVLAGILDDGVGGISGAQKNDKADESKTRARERRRQDASATGASSWVRFLLVGGWGEGSTEEHSHPSAPQIRPGRKQRAELGTSDWLCY
jgi:hypothetical protein